MTSIFKATRYLHVLPLTLSSQPPTISLSNHQFSSYLVARRYGICYQSCEQRRFTTITQKDIVEEDFSSFFDDGAVGNAIGSSFERDMRSAFESCGYFSFMYENLEATVDLMPWSCIAPSGKTPMRRFGEADTIVSGDFENLNNLLQKFPNHHIPPSLHLPTGRHIIVVEAKVSAQRLISDVLKRKDIPGISP